MVQWLYSDVSPYKTINSIAQGLLSPDFPKEIKRQVLTPHREMMNQSCLVQPAGIFQGSLQEHEWLKDRCTIEKFCLRSIFYLLFVYVCVHSCAGGYTHVHAHMYCTWRIQKTTSDAIPQMSCWGVFCFFVWDRVSYWPGMCQLGWAGWPERGLGMCSSLPPQQ